MRTSLLMAQLVLGIGSSRYALPRSSPVCVDLPCRLGQLTQQRLHVQLRHHRFDQHPVAVPCALPANRYPEISAGS
jgi:hypothetical protein